MAHVLYRRRSGYAESESACRFMGAKHTPAEQKMEVEIQTVAANRVVWENTKFRIQDTRYEIRDTKY
jgi:hypothetical protein